jgi:uncharacterized membrane protein YhhN
VTTAAWVLLVIAALLAAGDWVAVQRGSKRLEYVCKPATTIALLGVALAVDPAHSDTRAWFVAALAFSLAGDVFLMLPRDLFVAGLGSFLVAQLAFGVGYDLHGGSADEYVLGGVLVGAIVALLGARFVRALRRRGHGELLVPVVVYMLAIGFMAVSAVASANAYGVAGALLFVASDSLIAETRFVGERSWGRVAIMVTYHLALAGLVVSLV